MKKIWGSEKNNRNKTAKANISFKRRVTTHYTRITWFIKISFIIMMILMVFTSAFSDLKNQIRQYIYNITAQQGFVLENVIIQGQLNAPTIDIIKAIDASKGTPLFAINLDEVKKGLDNSSWIKMSIVERRLPNSLYIAINERNPIAIWQSNGKLYLIDEEGERISGKDIEKFPDLLHIVGDEANIYAKTLLDDLSACPDLMQKVRSAVRYGNRRWDLNFEDALSPATDSINNVFEAVDNSNERPPLLKSTKHHITVKMPENDFTKAYKYLENLNENNKFFGHNIKALDLRNNDKYYIEKDEKSPQQP